MAISLAAGLMMGSMGVDIFGGMRAKKKQEKLWKDFQRSLVKREAEQVDLERIARGEIQVSLSEGKKLFSQTMKAISASNSVQSRRLMEDLNRREAEASVRGRQRGLMGSSATSTEALAREREVFRAALDAETGRSAQMGQVLQAQAGFETQVRGQIADSFRREGQIGADSGRERRRALEGSRVNFSPISGAVGALIGQLGGMGGGGGLTPEAKLTGAKAALRVNPWTKGTF